MNKDTFLSALRAVLTMAGSYLLGHNLFGRTIDVNIWQEIAGAIVAVASIVWGIVDKPASIEGIQSAVRSVFISISGVLLSLGVVTQQTLDSVLAIILAILPVIQSHTSKVKVKQIADGTLQVSSDTGKVTPAGPKIK